MITHSVFTPERTVTRYTRSSSLLPVLGVLALSACTDGSAVTERVARATHGTGPVVVAAAWPWAAHAEARYGDGLDLAVRQVNATGGIGGRPLRIVRHDDEESVNTGRILAERLAADPDVVAVIGHLQSYVSVATAPTYGRAGLVMIAPTATDPALTEQGSDRIFRATFSEQQLGSHMAHAANSRGHRRLAIVYVRNRYGRGLANAFEESTVRLGGTIVARHSYEPADGSGSSAFAPIVADLSQIEFEGLFVAGEVPSVTGLLTELRRAGLTQPIYGGEAMSSPALFAAGPAAEGVILATSFHPDDPRPEVQTFVRDFRAQYGVNPDVGAAWGYDAARVLGAAMQQGRSVVPDSIAASLRRMPPWKGVTGTFKFTERGELVDRPLTLVAVRGGQFTFVPQTTAATGAVARAERAP